MDNSNKKAFTKEQFLTIARNLRYTAEDTATDVKEGFDPYKMSGQDCVKEYDPKLHTLMANVGKARKEMHDYITSHFEGENRPPV